MILRKDTESASNNELSRLTEIEKNHIKKVLELKGWNKTESAKILGIAKSTLYQKIEEYGISKT